MTRPHAILFDLDNTAYAYAPCHDAGLTTGQRVAAEWRDAWADAARFRADYDAARLAVKRFTDGTGAEHSRMLYFKAMTDRAFGRTHLAAVVALHDAYWRGYFDAMAVSPGCRELLAELRADGVRLAWVTNFTTERQVLKLCALGLSDAADFLVTSEEVGADKPDPRGVRHALELLGVEASRAWMVGDGARDDAESAGAAGVPFVWFRRDGDSAHPTAFATVETWAQLRALLYD